MVNIFIDESGGFIPLSPPRSRVSCIAAVILPSSTLDDALRDFSELTASFPSADREIKGSRLNESQVDQVLGLLSKHDALVEAITIDTGIHQPSDVSEFRLKQAAHIGHHIDKNPDPRVREQAKRLSRNLEAMSDQLFAQAWLTMVLTEQVVQKATMYFAVQAPAELDGFKWIIDAKEAVLTSSEDFWTTFGLPFSEERSRKRPFLLLGGADYSHFARFVNNGGKHGIDFRSILTEELSFRESGSEPGLQMADVVANAVSRAFNGRLQYSGWKRLPSLLVGFEPQVVQMAKLNPKGSGEDTRHYLSGRHEDVMRKLFTKRLLRAVPA